MSELRGRDAPQSSAGRDASRRGPAAYLVRQSWLSFLQDLCSSSTGQRYRFSLTPSGLKAVAQSQCQRGTDPALREQSLRHDEESQPIEEAVLHPTAE